MEADLIALVRLAISMHTWTGCLNFSNAALNTRLRKELGYVGSPNELKDRLIEYAAENGQIECRPEIRPEYQGRREFWFRVLVPVPGFTHPLFFELELIDDDPDCPAAVILNVHF